MLNANELLSCTKLFASDSLLGCKSFNEASLASELSICDACFELKTHLDKISASPSSLEIVADSSYKEIILLRRKSKKILMNEAFLSTRT